MNDDYTTYEVANVLKLFSYFFALNFLKKTYLPSNKLKLSQNISTGTNTTYIKSDHNKN